MTLEARAKGAQVVVVASVTDVQSRFVANESGDQLIVSQVTLNVEESLKGNERKQLTMQIEGGTVGDLTLRVSDMPAMAKGERAVIFLDQTASGVLVPHRRGLGVLKLTGSYLTGTDIPLTRVKDTVRQVTR
jgi:hypothetical protein